MSAVSNRVKASVALYDRGCTPPRPPLVEITQEKSLLDLPTVYDCTSPSDTTQVAGKIKLSTQRTDLSLPFPQVSI